MPGVIAVSDFVRETKEDFNSPTTSSFVHRIPQCKETVAKLEEVGHRNTVYCFRFIIKRVIDIFNIMVYYENKSLTFMEGMLIIS